MTAAIRGRRPPLLVVAAVVAGLALLVLANGHLVYVSIMSQPDCVDHRRIGDAAAVTERFAAARSACSP